MALVCVVTCVGQRLRKFSCTIPNEVGMSCQKLNKPSLIPMRLAELFCFIAIQ